MILQLTLKAAFPAPDGALTAVAMMFSRNPSRKDNEEKVSSWFEDFENLEWLFWEFRICSAGSGHDAWQPLVRTARRNPESPEQLKFDYQTDLFHHSHFATTY